MESDKLTEYRLERLERESAEDSKFRREVREMLAEIKTDVAVQKAKTTFLGGAAGVVGSIPALIVAFLRGGTDAPL